MSQELISQQIVLASEQETELLAQDISVILQAGDCVCLYGGLGAGKTTLARAIIRSIARNSEYEVPSPTYTLRQTYATSPQIHHFDFYRLNDPQEVEELGLEEALEFGLALIEWPQIYSNFVPQDSIHIEIFPGEGEARTISIKGECQFMERFARSKKVREFLEAKWRPDLVRNPLMGDASTRAYELVSDGQHVRLLMNSKRTPDGPVIPEYGKPYSQIAHLAEEVSAFVAVDELLREHGFNAPEIYARDLDEGLLLTEYLGDEPVITGDRDPIAERYRVAMELLAGMHQIEWPEIVPIEDHRTHRFAHYDEDATLIEVSLFTDWYMPHILSRECTASELEEFRQIWKALYRLSSAGPQTLVLRDFHSPNLIWQEGAAGTNRISLIDFQDALIGPESYDVASLAQDARVTVDDKLEKRLVDHYVNCRKTQNAGFDESEFAQSYAIMAAQRATKVLGIFVRLHKRDKKPAYLQHIPRIRSYLDRCFTHPVLAEYKNWFERLAHEPNG